MLLERFDLASKAKQVYTKLSGGMKRRLTLARALIHEPRLVILDEPTAGVDVELRLELWSLLRELNTNGTTIILTTHYLEEAEELCDRIGIIQTGKLVALETTQQLIGDGSLQDVFLELTAGRLIGNPVGFQTLVKREMVRTFSIINQVIWPPVIQTLLYVFVFGLALGSQHQERASGVLVRAVPHPRADHAAGDRPDLQRELVVGLPRPLHELDPGAADRAALGDRDGARLRRRGRRCARSSSRC